MNVEKKRLEKADFCIKSTDFYQNGAFSGAVLR
jgi:hypothetical protein